MVVRPRGAAIRVSRVKRASSASQMSPMAIGSMLTTTMPIRFRAWDVAQAAADIRGRLVALVVLAQVPVRVIRGRVVRQVPVRAVRAQVMVVTATATARVFKARGVLAKVVRKGVRGKVGRIRVARIRGVQASLVLGKVARIKVRRVKGVARGALQVRGNRRNRVLPKVGQQARGVTALRAAVSQIRCKRLLVLPIPARAVIRPVRERAAREMVAQARGAQVKVRPARVRPGQG